ncbi:hypothetical protein CBM2598_U30020 [Cupriavidus taiwanensis]|uniref:Uncharacterized protein n=1 Tax=Cupriavidus taiwanensis TaxID=164546 RepID=A0A7Z7JG42_9BURK|nr:hypothetical protein CBM2597_U30020 [Cupriavidus taiwanensis]SOZ96961.1 hypothetical protein CBM2598_U30020 [Cupriavidus taiwanensis]SPC25960.1 hypothetical protein CBM2594_U20147 [Cupriavidus taiwanensis]
MTTAPLAALFACRTVMRPRIAVCVGLVGARLVSDVDGGKDGEETGALPQLGQLAARKSSRCANVLNRQYQYNEPKR